LHNYHLKNFQKLLYIFVVFIYLSPQYWGQDKYNTVIITDFFQMNFDNKYPFSAVSVIPNTEIITLRGHILSGDEYLVSYTGGYFSLSDSVHIHVSDTVFVTYQAFKVPLQKEYKRRVIVVRYDDRFSDTLRVMQNKTESFTTDAIFGHDLQKSGSISRGFTIGTTRNFSLNSGLHLQLSGRLSDDVEIVVALTDENTPIQPEGNTERLDELDKVFIEVKHPNASGVFGDYDFKGQPGEFGSVDRKLQGLKGEFNYGSSKGTVAVASSKGKFNNNQFAGLDGVQGPYHLNGVNSERDIIIIAGSEKVYFNGEAMKRGERNDYTIDYSNAEISFTPQRLITSASRISVDFEYTDRRYSRSFFGIDFMTGQTGDKFKVKFNYFREGDNQDSPVDISLSDEDKKILALAGNDRLLASKTGIVVALPDSAGQIKGVYSKTDTVISEQPFSFYIYNPGRGLFNVSFSYVGQGKGDYNRESLGNYRFTGISQGSYLPVIFLPMPELKQTGNVSVEVLPFKDVSLNVEFAGSIWNKNRFSEISGKDNSGIAGSISLTVMPQPVKLGDIINLGRAGVSYKDRFIQDRFTAPDRMNEVEFSRNYNVLSGGSPVNEWLREVSITLLPNDKLMVNSMYGYLKRGGDFVSKRFVGEVKLLEKEHYNAGYKLDYAGTRDIGYSGGWYRHSGNVSYSFGRITPAVSFLAEDKKDKINMTDSLIPGSLSYFEASPGIELSDWNNLNFRMQYSFREDSFPVNGIMKKESRSAVQSYEISYRGIQEVSSSLNLTLRNKRYTDIFKRRGEINNETILIRSQSRFNFWQNLISGDLYYESSTQRVARLQRVFVKVQQGTGNYKYLGDINNNGISDQNEFEPAVYDGDYIILTLPTDELFPVIELKLNSRWKVNPGKIFHANTLAGALLSPVTTETVFRVEENSRETDTKKIYLLQFSSFLNDSTTVKGVIFFQHDLFIFENSNELSFRFRFSETKRLTQFSEGSERGYNNEKSVRIRLKMIEEAGNQTDIAQVVDNVVAPQSSNRAGMILVNSLTSDFSYHPVRNVESGFKISVSRSRDALPKNPTVINQNLQMLRLILSFAGTGRFKFEVERNELLVNTSLNYIPFEMTRGNLTGKNYFWRVNFEYRLTANLQSSVAYDGRIQGQGSVIHTARAEVMAFF